MNNYDLLYRRFLLCRSALIALLGVTLLLTVCYAPLIHKNRELSAELVQWRTVGDEIVIDRGPSNPSAAAFGTMPPITPAWVEEKYFKTRYLDSEKVSRAESAEATLEPWRESSFRWEFLARAMSKEADRRHLDKNFPRVQD
jgi:hypothetical protein